MDKYFAIKLDADDLMKKVQDYFDVLDSIGFEDAISRSFNYYYGRGLNGKTTKISAGGSQGELSELMVNDYRSFIRYMLTLIASERPAFDVRAVNTDYKSEAQAIVGEDVLNHYLKHQKLETKLRDATENALWSSEGFVALDWDVDAGEFYGKDPDNDRPIMKGDIKYSIYNAKTCIRDPFGDPEDPDWVILVDTINRYELAEKYPEHREAILSETTKDYDQYMLKQKWHHASDIINVFKFYHKKNVVLPEGKYGIFIPEVLCEQGPLPYEEIPVYRVTPGNMDGYAFGYTPAFDILGLQEANSDLFSALLTNNRSFARQIIAISRDAGVNHRVLTEGMSILELDSDDMGRAIQPLQLTKSAPETYNFLESIVGRMEKYTGINEVVRGDPSANLRSGNALALIAAQAIKYNATLQQSYNQLIEDVGTATLRFLKQFAKAPRFYTVVGTHNKSLLKEFSAESIENVDRVEVQRASALTNTTAGRIELADNLLQNGMIRRPEQYISVLETGKLDPLLEAERTELLNIKAENEMLFEGNPPSALITDNHALHIREHKAVLDDPELRKEPQIIEAVMAHLQEHMALWEQVPPSMLMATGQQPPPMMQPMVPPQGEPTGEGVNEGAMEPTNPGESGNPDMPSLPDVPDAASPEDAAALQQLGLSEPR